MAERTSLRERKKQRTRELIVAHALELFDQHGFDRVTIADIAEAAEIAPRTFFAYFPSKEAVVFHDFDAFFTAISTRILERPAGETTIAALRSWIAELLAELDPTDPAERCRRRVIEASPSLRAHDRTLITRFEDVFAEGFARDLGVPASSLRARVAAAAGAAALQELERFFDKDDADPMPVIDEALTFIRGGVDALRVR